MADKEINDLTDGGKVQAGDKAHVVRSGNSRKVDLEAQLPATRASSSGPASLDFAEDTDNGSNKVTLSAPATLAADVTVTLPSVSGALEFIPAGLTMFSPMGSVPTGWLACEGGTFSSSTYPALYAYLGNSTTLPDMRDRVPRGAGTLAGSSGTTQADAFQGHHHAAVNHNLRNSSISYVGGAGIVPNEQADGTNSDYTASGVRSAKSDGTNGTPRVAEETRVKAYIGKWVIKAA